MNLLNNHKVRSFVSLALLISGLAVLVKFDGIVTVQVTPLGLQVQVRNHSSGCLMKPQLIDPELA